MYVMANDAVLVAMDAEPSATMLLAVVATMDETALLVIPRYVVEAVEEGRYPNPKTKFVPAVKFHPFVEP